MLDIKKNKKQIYKYLILSIFFLIFGIIYESYSHGVYSNYMIYAFTIPLLLGFIVYLIIYKGKFYKYLSELGMSIYNSFVITLTIRNIMKGFLEIYGTTNSLVFIYSIMSFLLLIISVIVNIYYNLRKKGKKMKKKIILILLIILFGITGCNSSNNSSKSSSLTTTTNELLNSDLFTSRDLEQNVDTSDATKYTVSDGEDITITKEGTYVISGSAKDVSIIVNVDNEEKVQLVLSNLSIENDSTPCIYVKNADKVFITLTGNNSLKVNEAFTSDETINTDAVIFSKDDLVINGTGSLNISSSNNGITSKDGLKITGGIINITSISDALEANNFIAIYNGNITINSKKDGLHAEYDEDASLGYIYITGGTLNITSIDDAIHATTIVEIDGGSIKINSKEGIEGTYIQINDGTLNITATDDGINAGNKSSKYDVTIEINGGTINIDMGQGDTDAIDSNGNLYINDGIININANSPFDYDGEGELNGGSITVNGEETTELTNQMMGGRNGQRGRR